MPRRCTAEKIIGTSAARQLAQRRLARGAIEVLVLTLSLITAFAYRFEFPLAPFRVAQMVSLLPMFVPLGAVALRLSGAHRHSWRYVGLRDLADIIVAVVSVAVVLLAIRFAPIVPLALKPPIGVILANMVTSLVGLCGVRLLRRLLSERREARGSVRTGTATRRVLLVGAGRAGVMVASDLRRRPDLGIVPVGFVDDDLAKQGRRIASLDVLGTTEDLAALAEAFAVDEAVLAMASVSRADIRRIVDACRTAGLATKIVPGLYEIVGGQVDLTRIRPVNVEDLLGRDPVDLDAPSLDELLRDRSVMITGAGGSIGSELVRQAARFGPSRLVLLERAEPALWAIGREITAAYPELRVEACIGDVTDAARVRQVFEEHRPDVVVHAAAHKHVPMMEHHPGEAVKNNVGGTRTVVDLAVAHDVETFVLVSTDKAVNPTSVMGATKRVCELYVHHVAARTGRRYVSVRFGNVLGSTGSVVPIFEEQVRSGGPVTVTHPDMVRYFMTIPEAAGLVLQAGALGRSQEVLVLDMGAPVRIVELAEAVIRTSGLEPGADVEIQFTGLRPGEKMFEELSLDDEGATRTRHPKVWIGRQTATHPDVPGAVAALLGATDAPARDVVARLAEVVVEYTPDLGVHRPRSVTGADS